MKFLTVVSFCFLCLLGSTVGLQCYQCKDITPGSRCKETAIITCGLDHSDKYCATYSFVENNETVVQKACVLKEQDVCKIGESVKVDLDSKIKGGSLLCCEGNLCNSSNKLSGKNTLFYPTLAVCILSLISYLIN